MIQSNLPLVISSGDYGGIGPEIIAKSLEKYIPESGVVITGDYKDFRKASPIEIPEIEVITKKEEILKGRIQFLDISNCRSRFHRSFEFVKIGVDLIEAGYSNALVTAPISKDHWQKSGVSFSGHTTYLAGRTGVEEYAMFFWSEKLKVVLFTIHLPLSSVFSKLEKGKLRDFITFVNRSLKSYFNHQYKFILSGLNPHAGENGILGKEEQDILEPVVRDLEGEMYIEGPDPPDTVFLKALESEDTVVVSMYHDQGLIPFKLLNMHKGVNMTLGLPFIRTSPDHGTAFEIAGQGKANAGSMLEAMKLADSLNRKLDINIS